MLHRESFGPGTIALLNAAMLVPVFRRYAPEPLEPEEEA